jgi:hypothetical protein
MGSKHLKCKKYCGTCQHYSWIIPKGKKTTCNNLGSIDTTPACTQYSVNPFILQDFEKVLQPLADTLRAMPLTVLPLFYEIISQERNLRKRGFHFMEKVAVKYFGTASDQYVSNYIIGHVFSATDTGVFIIGKTGVRMFALKESVLKLSDFIQLRRVLKEKNLIVDPMFEGRTSAKQKLAVVETIDDIIGRGVVDDLDFEIKSKLSPKRLNSSLQREVEKRTELTLSTLSKKKKKGDR